MPADHRILSARKLVLVTAREEVTRQDIRRLLEELGRDDAFEPSYDLLIDARAVTRADLPSDYIRQLAQVGLFASSSRHAIAVERDVLFGMARMYELLSQDPGCVRVFRDLKDARDWLGLASDSPAT